MESSFNEILAATLTFVGGHFLLSSQPLRRSVVPRRLTLPLYRALYSVLVLAAFVWMVRAYYGGPFYSLWYPPPVMAWVPLVVMPLATILIVCGLTTPNPTAVGGEQLVTDEAGCRPIGIITVTRHPFLWGTALWAASHLCVRGDLASITLMGGILILSLGGMRHIDLRRESDLGAAWGPVKLTTSALPFAAVLSRRTSLDWRGIGWWRPALGIAVYLVLIFGHQKIIGFDPLALF